MSAPEHDPVARAMRRARIAKRLFGTDEQVRIGRYQLLQRVGAGGIGVVWGAWDPELERRVAIKLLQPMTGVPRERIVLEGQALAKLSHPNVVPIYDVGVHGDQVFLVMEWVRGRTLRRYAAERRSVRELVDVYRAAADGLAAAHAVDLIHRDFKPENAILGEDTRVRVLDFGLASPRDDAPVTRGAGTPRYMAPEQAAGGALTPSTDQYALCVALREALVNRDGPGTRASVPSWLDAILARGAHVDPRQRFPSMRELSRALARDPATVRRRRAVAGGAAGVVAAVAFAVGGAAQPGVAPCSGGAEALASTWNDRVRAAMVAHVRGLGAYGALEADRLGGEMATYGERWVRVQQGACLARERRQMTAEVYDRALGCLTRARVEYDTVVEVLATTSASRLSDAVVAARGLPELERCPLDSAVSNVPLPPRSRSEDTAQLASDIERARVLATTGDPQGVAATRAAVARADALAYTPLVARAHLAHGLALLEHQDARAAIPFLDRAALAAIDAFDDPTFVEAHARAVYARSVTGAAGAGPSSDYVERVARRAGAAGAFARALLYNNLGAARLTAGDPAGARTWFDRALAETTVRDGDAELLGAYANRALVTDDATERDRYLADARTRLTALLGANHRKTLDARFQAAFLIVDPGRAAAELEAVCTALERYHAAAAANTIANCRFELGWLAEARGDVATARAAFARVDDGDGPLRATAAAYLLGLDGKLAAAAAAARVAGDRFRTDPWARFNAADAYRLAATYEGALGRSGAAAAHARTALELFGQLAFLARTASYQRRLERTRALVAATPRRSTPR